MKGKLHLSRRKRACGPVEILQWVLEAIIRTGMNVFIIMRGTDAETTFSAQGIFSK
jgi:hypothetical protein